MSGMSLKSVSLPSLHLATEFSGPSERHVRYVTRLLMLALAFALVPHTRPYLHSSLVLAPTRPLGVARACIGECVLPSTFNLASQICYARSVIQGMSFIFPVSP